MLTRLAPSGVILDGLDLSSYDDKSGVEVCVQTIEGWSGSPGSSLSVEQRLAQAGGWGSPNPQLGARLITLSGYVAGPPDGVDDMVDRINGAAALGKVRLEVSKRTRTRWATVQRQDEVEVDDTLADYQPFTMQLVATDPFKYGDTLVGSTGLPSTAGGLAVPHAVPFALTSTITSGVVVMRNDGNASGPVLLRIYGPVTAPVVTHLGTGRAIALSSSLTIAAGDWLEVDMRRKTALLNGTAPRSGWLVERGWSDFEEGGNTWAFTSPLTTPGARLEVTATNAWK